MITISTKKGNALLAWVEDEPIISVRRIKLNGLLKKYEGFDPDYLEQVQAGVMV